MFGWTFDVSDIGKVGLLLLLEALLSADNALILAIIVRHLPREQQRKALFYGLAGAFVLRTAAIFLAAKILDFWWLQLIGAMYLIYLPVKHFIAHGRGSHSKVKAGSSFWMTVVQAEMADLAFAIDSVLVAVAVVHKPEKLWVVFTGAILGLILLRFAANWCLKFLERYPILDHVAYLIVGWAGIKLLLVSGHTWDKWFEARYKLPAPIQIPEMSPAVFWGGLLTIAAVGSFIAFRRPAEVSSKAIDLFEVTPDEEVPVEKVDGK